MFEFTQQNYEAYKDVCVRKIAELSRDIGHEPASVEPRLQTLDDVKAVLFDVGGTLCLMERSFSEWDNPDRIDQEFGEILTEYGVDLIDIEPLEFLREKVWKPAGAMRAAREGGEAKILECFQQGFQEAADEGVCAQRLSLEKVAELHLEFALRSRTFWPAPGMTSTLLSLSDRGLSLGIVSNAQFFHRFLFEALCGFKMEQLGLDPDLVIWSCDVGYQKPALETFQPALNVLQRKNNLLPSEVLYVGNDMYADVYGASKAGMRTAFAALDARCTELCEDNESIPKGLDADVVLTDLSQLLRVCPGLDSLKLPQRSF